MRAPPELRGGFAVRFVSLVVGLWLCAAGVVAFLESELGLPPWAVLHQGLSEVTPLSFGEATLVVSVVVLVASWRLGAVIGLGTLLDALLVGSFIIVLTSIERVDDLSRSALTGRVALTALGLALLAIGTALYIGAGMGAGARDSLMLVTARHLRTSIGVARTLTEVTALVVGFALGGTVGAGTVAFALGIGPAAPAAFAALSRAGLAK